MYTCALASSQVAATFAALTNEDHRCNYTLNMCLSLECRSLQCALSMKTEDYYCNGRDPLFGIGDMTSQRRHDVAEHTLFLDGQ